MIQTDVFSTFLVYRIRKCSLLPDERQLFSFRMYSCVLSSFFKTIVEKWVYKAVTKVCSLSHSVNRLAFIAIDSDKY